MKLTSKLRVLMLGFCIGLVPMQSVATCNTLSTPLLGALANMDWNNAFPITVMGFPIGQNSNPPRMYEPPVCICPSRLLGGIPIPGIGVTYWNPLYLVDSSNEAGCMQSMGLEILEGYSAQNSGDSGRKGQRRQVHWFEFPLFSMLEIFNDLACSAANKGFDLAYMTEIDPIWQDDLWSALFNPEGVLVANPLARIACSADAIASNISYPIDALFWCAGPHHMYPTSGNSNASSANEDTNMKLMTRFMFRHHRVGALWETIGPEAQCQSVYTPVMPKSQYRIDPVFPSAENGGSPIYPGKKYMFWRGVPPPLASYPTHESAAYVIWRGTQCCIRF